MKPYSGKCPFQVENITYINPYTRSAARNCERLASSVAGRTMGGGGKREHHHSLFLFPRETEGRILLHTLKRDLRVVRVTRFF